MGDNHDSFFHQLPKESDLICHEIDPFQSKHRQSSFLVEAIFFHKSSQN